MATLVLTPIVREMNRRLGMVDKPDARRINKVPIPRGGGIAVVVGVIGTYLAYHFISGRPAMAGLEDAQFYRMALLAIGVAVLGYVDDKISMKPRLKLLGQIVIAALVWLWAGLGFRDLWPSLPAWADCIITVFWLVGAMNAFNLIDGLDGLASGISLIAVMGMAGSLWIVGKGESALFYCAIGGGLLGFLKYNYNPASVFLGDSGSMFLGFLVSSLPLTSHVSNSFLVSVGVPLLAMGVPIFDTSLAIFRRSLRRLINNNATGEVMTADKDHLHHRLLRSTGLSQRKAAWLLYAGALGAVGVGLGSMCLEDRAAGLWLIAVTIGGIVIFRDMAMVEFFDAGTLLSRMVHTHDFQRRKELSRLATPILLALDVTMLAVISLGVTFVTFGELDESVIRVALPIRVVSVVGCLVAFKAYRTVWPRAMLSNFMRLGVACVLGSVLSSAIIYYVNIVENYRLVLTTVVYAMATAVMMGLIRVARTMVRDAFYAMDCSRLKQRKDVSRILVYGAGLRYRAFRRELVRSTAANTRIIMGLLDDDVLLRGRYIGGLQVMGTLNEAPEIINRLNVDTVVVACAVSEEWKKVMKDVLAPTGVKVVVFAFSEQAAW